MGDRIISHAVWCHRKNCEGDCGHRGSFSTPDETVDRLKGRIIDLEWALRRIEGMGPDEAEHEAGQVAKEALKESDE